MTAIELRFELHCEGAAPALNGAIRWDVNDDSAAPGPTEPPAGLWEPPAGAVPVTGSYAYLESQPGETVPVGSPAVTITNLSDRWIRIYVPETSIGREPVATRILRQVIFRSPSTVTSPRPVIFASPRM